MWASLVSLKSVKQFSFHAEAQQAAKGKEAASQRPVSMGDEPEQDEEDDLLPPEVLDAVIKQSRCALSSAFLV